MDPNLKMYFLLNMGIIQPAMLVYQKLDDACGRGISIRKERMTVTSRNFLTDKDRFCITVRILDIFRDPSHEPCEKKQAGTGTPLFWRVQ